MHNSRATKVVCTILIAGASAVLGTFPGLVAMQIMYSAFDVETLTPIWLGMIIGGVLGLFHEQIWPFPSEK